MSWGVELWDKYSELTNHAHNGIDFLENGVAAFVKERGKVEADYAKSLRALVKRFTPKEMVPARPPSEEFTHIRAYKQMLTEVGFQAGQHEVLAENFCKEQYKSVQESVKRLREQRKKNMKEAERISNELRQAYKTMDVCKDKFRKAYEEQEKATALYVKANAEGSVTRNEVNKLQTMANKSNQHCDSAKGKYASQLVRTNEFQSLYYREMLPQLLAGLQQLEQERIEIGVAAVLSCVAKEREVNPIVLRCLDAVEVAMKGVDAAEDNEIAIDRFKSGDVPPADFKFDEINDTHAILTKDPVEKPSNLNLYPKKRELEKSIEEAERELQKKQKELKGLQVMVASYKNNPKFGNSKHFAGEIENLHKSIVSIEEALRAMRANLSVVEDRLQSLQERSPMMAGGSPMMTLARDRTARSSQSSGSLKSLSVGSNSHTMNTSPDSEAVYDAVQHENIYNDDDWDRDDFDEPPPPPSPQPTMATATATAVGTAGRRHCVALYPYPGQGVQLQESNIPMAEGEEFEVVEADSDGWTRVRRLGRSNNAMMRQEDAEGYVPTSFLKLVM